MNIDLNWSAHTYISDFITIDILQKVYDQYNVPIFKEQVGTRNFVLYFRRVLKLSGFLKIILTQ